jgi:hypothetical protein
MVDIEPASIELTFYSVNGELSEQTVTHYAPFHFLGPFSPATVRSVKVGSKVALYGNILKNIKGQNVQDYLHLREGHYVYNAPFQWLTLHATLLPS